MVPPAETIKHQANINEAFNAGDYQTATALYSYAIKLDADNPLYVLNRSMSNLKLAKYVQTVYTLCYGGFFFHLHLHLQLSIYPEATSRTNRKRFSEDLGPGGDLAGFVVHGGSQDVADRQRGPLAVDSTQALAPISPTAGQEGYEIKDTALSPRISKRVFEPSFIERLQPSALVRFLSLHNAYNAKGTNIFIEIHRTNAPPIPNTRYSFHADRGQLRIFALTDIAIDEEIRVSYLSSRNVYGSTRNERRARFLANFNFARMCTACSLEGAALRASDDRRREMPILQDDEA
ncbi:hypothetical protein B0H11DRAFT_2386371 [Mycena galericulata]|nr:hypothetical protein B0H11DRAFT_2386371 [Mycena galericulata]